MKTVLLRVTVAAMTTALTFGVALADHESYKKKKKRNFFESLFSRNDFSRDRENWDIQQKQRKRWGRSDNGVRFIYGSRSDNPWYRKNLRKDFDPEPEFKGLGTGNLTYVADKLVSLGGGSFKEPRPADAAAAAIFDALASKDLGIRVVPEIKLAILDHYRAQGFSPLWLDGGKASGRARSVLKILASAADEGMQPAHYRPPALSDFDAVDSLPADDLAALARFELGMTAMTLKYARDASGGQFDPRRLSRYNDITPERVAPADALGVLAKTYFPARYLQGLQPQHGAYGAMKTALAELRKEMDDKAFEPIAKGPRVKLGQADPRIPAIRKRLASLDGGKTSDITDDLLDSDLAEALQKFQKTAKLKATGRIDNSTVNALNSQGEERNLTRLADNMERMRWLPKNLGNRHVLVNQPAFQVRVMDGQSEVWRSKVIVGKTDTQTSSFHDEIETVVFNPSWGVPPSIIANEYLPKLWNDPSYLDRIGFKVTTQSGRQIDSSDVDWWNYSGKVPFNIQQPPGADNALGELKFLFPNSHNIYMHDTPTKKLFAEDVRTFSHGCIRVENPREFATVLLGWERSKVDANTEGKQSQTIALDSKVPVHITYFTAWPDADGKIQYYNDIYARDAAMDKAMTATLLAQR
ncbi:MAG: L,D-transpeptidase family protein [Rhizobiales bacterium]|nr:L,D-transpeptidase family protein [Hyphomicrobiales bacterium]